MLGGRHWAVPRTFGGTSRAPWDVSKNKTRMYCDINDKVPCPPINFCYACLEAEENLHVHRPISVQVI